MEFKDDKQELLIHIAICVVAAIFLYGAAEKLTDGGNFNIPEKYLCWLRDNKVQAFAVIAAVLYGVSLAIWPTEKKALPCDDPIAGYERAGGL